MLEKLLYPELIELARREGVHDAVNKLETTLREIHAVLTNAEEKQITDENVKIWLEELCDWVYDADDILDEIATDALSRNKAKPQSSTSNKVRSLLIPSCCPSSFGPREIVFDLRIGSKINEINSQLQAIVSRKTPLGLLEKVVGEPYSRKLEWQKPPSTSSLVIEPIIHGRDKDREKIIEELLSEEPCENKYAVIPIVGMGGIGKTTLAQHLYNDEKVTQHFNNLKAWVCVSDDDFDVTRITKEILISFTSKHRDLEKLDELQVRLSETLTGKKFLLVLDDMWNMMYDKWHALRTPFRAGAHGSKIIVTTRNRDVLSEMGIPTNKYHYLENLSNDDCWSIFAQHAFQNTNIGENPNLEFIGKKIVEKCRGLPLAARTVGGLLSCQPTEDEWEAVLNSDIWNSSNKKNGVLPALELSYHHLPSHLKRCFGYCAVIPKDYVFEEKEIVLLWMAQGLIQEPKGRNDQQMEDLGGKYFHELVSRSLFQPRSSDANSQFIMHDLINDLARDVARKLCFRLEGGHHQHKIDKKAHHLSYTRSGCDGIQKFENIEEAESLRTFLPIGSSENNVDSYFITSYVPRDLLPRLKCLRVLCLSEYYITELPDSIGDLKHLRYLNLSSTHIRRLPESVATLYNLQVMLLKECKNLQKLPPKMGNLINLRHLDTTGALKLEEMPLQMGELTHLQTLSNFIVGRGSGSSIRELRNLPNLRGTISISKLENVIDPRDAMEANLIEKRGLEELILEWGGVFDSSSRNDTNVLDLLQPHLRLEKLIIKGYAGTRFPTWLGDVSFSNMVMLTLENCQNCASLPPLGQLPALKVLWIEGMNRVEQVGPEFYGEDCSKPFPSLKILIFWNMEEWKDWCFGVDKEIEPFTNLTELVIFSCFKLVGKLPNNLPSLEELRISKCPELVVVGPELIRKLNHSPSLATLPERRNFSVGLGSLTHLYISDVSVPGSLSYIHDDANTTSSNHLTHLSVNNITNITFLPVWFMQGLTGLKELVIGGCGDLVSLFVEEEDIVEEQQQQPQLRMLEHLQINDCEKLEELPRGLHTLTFLRELMIRSCPRLISFPKTGLPSSLRKLSISECTALESLTEVLMHNNTSIEILHVSHCPSLTSLSSSKGAIISSPTLKYLDISYCENLESIIASAAADHEGFKIMNSSLDVVKISYCNNLKSLPDGLYNLSSLNLCGCDNLESLPEGWLAGTNLRLLVIDSCKKLEALPNRAHNLTSLQSLFIGGFPSIVCYLRQGGFPIKLNVLMIHIPDIIRPPYPSEWGLHGLSSLRVLYIYGITLDLVSFPEDGMSLPTSLTELNITAFRNLKYLSSEFGNLTSLEILEIDECLNLTSFPDNGLPQSLLKLEINGCPLLKQRYEKGSREYQRVIAQIPSVHIDGRFIFDTEAD